MDGCFQGEKEMPEDLFSEIHEVLTPNGKGRMQYTRRAFRMLPELSEPLILDIGCGPGEPTIELARLSGGWIVGIDTNMAHLVRLAGNANGKGLGDRVQAVRCSMFDICFQPGAFDVLWAEGSIFNMGFERGIVEWGRYLRDEGFLVVHEMVWLRNETPREIRRYWKEIYPGISTVVELLGKIPGRGYDVIGSFALSEDAWWIEYYGPLEKRIGELRVKYADEPEARVELDREQGEIDIYKKCRKWYGSAFFVMRKSSGSLR